MFQFFLTFDYFVCINMSMHLQDCKSINPEVLVKDRGSLINPRAVWSINEDDEDDLTLKYVGKRVKECENNSESVTSSQLTMTA